MRRNDLAMISFLHFHAIPQFSHKAAQGLRSCVPYAAMKSISLSSSLSEINSQCEKIRQMQLHALLLHPRRATRFSTFVYLHKALLRAVSFFSPFSSTPLLRDVHLDGQVRSHKNSVI
jgi:hypothetical protein